MAFQAIPAGISGPLPRLARAVAVSAGLRLVAAVVVWLCASAGASQAQPTQGSVSASTDNGFARLVFRFSEEVGASIRLANNILIVSFVKPVSVNVERLNTDAHDYVSAARLDPDGKAVRIALGRKVKANLIPASERLFLDLLPDTWTGLAPGLPADIVEELTRRGREAEKRALLQQQVMRWKKVPPIRVRVATQPTFTRYTFPLSSLIAVASDRGQDELTMVFDAPLRFDLADAQAALPPFIASIEPKLDEDTASVRFAFNGTVDLRTFREDNDYILDVSAATTARPSSESISRPSNDLISKVIEELERTVPPPGAAKAAPTTAPQAPPATAPPAAVAAEPAKPTAQPLAASAKREPATAPAVTAPRQPPPPADSRKASAIETVPASPPPEQPVAPPMQPTAPAVPAVQADAAAAKPIAPPLAAKPVTPPLADTRVKPVTATLARLDNAVRIVFPFATPTPAAMFRRADVMWLIFDSEAAIDVDALRADLKGLIRGVNVSQNDGQVVRLKLDRPRLGSMAMQGAGWAVTIGDQVTDPIMPLTLNRTIVGPARASIVIPFDDARHLHRITDPEAGDTLLVVSALAPVRGLLKQQEFVELRALGSTHGIVVQPQADDLKVEITPDRVVIGRPNGLTLSAHAAAGRREGAEAPTLFNVEQWTSQRKGDFSSRQSQLFNAAAAAPPERQSAVHRNLARFYMAREMFVEARAALDIALSADHGKDEEAGMYVLRAVAKLMSGRTKEALKDLAQPSVGNQHDAPLWRALAYALEGKWAEAREGFQNTQMTIGMMPIQLQRFMLLMSVRAALEVGDLDSAASQLTGFEAIGAPPEQQPEIDLLRGRIAEKLGRTGDAIAAYQTVVVSNDRRAATQARLRQAILRMSIDDLKRPDAIAEFETISVIWRGDDTEIEALQMLAKLYTEDGRLRDAFGAMRSALTASPQSELTRSIQDEAAVTFQSLFLSDKGDALPAIDALSLFYDFRDLTPMGRRGDEIVRRLADRLVSIDLLDQASELLQHQVDKRLQGAARAQVATRLAMIYLMNNKPDRALAVLRATHVAGFSDTLRDRRLLLESRALSEVGRSDVALEVIANIKGREADRLRADILWRAQRWRKAAEQIEAMLGDRWRDFQPLNGSERNDVLRVGVGYALGKDAIGMDRLRARYAAKMMDGPDRHAFEIVTSRTGKRGAEFNAIATNVGSTDTLDAFLSDLRSGISDLAAKPSKPPPRQDAPPNVVPRRAAPTTGQAPATAPATAR